MWRRIFGVNNMGLCPECTEKGEMVTIQESFDINRICDRCEEEY